MSEQEDRGLRQPRGGEKRRLIVVVDNDDSYLYYTTALLKRLDYGIVTAKTAEEALMIIREARPSLVLTELDLPQVSGLDLLGKIKKDPRTQAIPVVIYTLSADAYARDACVREGCSAYLRKPLDPDELYAAIQNATESSPRRYLRLAACVKLVVGDEPSDECMVALSEEGMYASTTRPKRVGERLQLTFFLGNAKVQAEGTVLYSFFDDSGPMKSPGMGIKFSRITPEDQAVIRAFIKHHVTEGLPSK